MVLFPTPIVISCAVEVTVIAVRCEVTPTASMMTKPILREVPSPMPDWFSKGSSEISSTAMLSFQRFFKVIPLDKPVNFFALDLDFQLLVV